MGNNNTIIENVEYLDMDDSKNSWYFDAEKFDINFPLVRSYRSQLDWSSERLFQEWYEYWDTVFSYYAAMPDTFGICFAMDIPSAFSTERGASDLSEAAQSKLGVESNYLLNSRVIRAFADSKLFLYSKQSLGGGKRFSYSLAIARDSTKLINLKERFYLSDFYYGSMGRLPLYPHTQLIISRDWDLLKRYFFFMIRNHQYKGSKFIYTVGKGNNEDIRELVDVTDSAFSSLPADFRFNWAGLPEDLDVSLHEVLSTSRKLTSED